MELKYRIDADGYLICEPGGKWDSLAEIPQHHVEPLSKILNSHADLLDACKFAKSQIKKGAQKKALPILRAAIAKATKN